MPVLLFSIAVNFIKDDKEGEGDGVDRRKSMGEEGKGRRWQLGSCLYGFVCFLQYHLVVQEQEYGKWNIGVIKEWNWFDG